MASGDFPSRFRMTVASPMFPFHPAPVLRMYGKTTGWPTFQSSSSSLPPA
jgi:hypothetical protein